MDSGYDLKTLKTIETNDPNVKKALDALSWADPNTDTHPQDAMVFLFVTFFIGVITKLFLEHVKRRFKVAIPYSVTLFLIGGAIGYSQWKCRQLEVPFDSFLSSATRWTGLAAAPHFLLFLFLPPLIFETSMHTDFFVFSNHLGSAMVLAGPCVAIQATLIGAFLKAILPYNWGWVESILLGGILSATDPVAVISLLKGMGVCEDLSVLIEGESVLNDATGIVLFELCGQMILSNASPGSFVTDGIRLVVGGPLIGIAFFIVCKYMLRILRKPNEQTAMTVCAAYLCYYVCEGTPVRVSGVLAVFTLGCLMSGFGRSDLNADAKESLHIFWDTLVYCSETLIFVLAGAIVMDHAFLSKSGLFLAQDWGFIIVIYIWLVIIRFFVVTLASVYIRPYGHMLDSQSCSFVDYAKQMFVVAWGGLRGAVGLCLALAVNANPNYRLVLNDPFFADRVLGYTSGVVVLTLLINATTVEYFITLLGLTKSSTAEQEIYQGAIKYLDDVYQEYTDLLQQNRSFPMLAAAKWDMVEQLTQHSIVEQEKEADSSGKTGGSSIIPSMGHYHIPAESPSIRPAESPSIRPAKRVSILEKKPPKRMLSEISTAPDGSSRNISFWDGSLRPKSFQESTPQDPEAIKTGYRVRFLMSLKAQYMKMHDCGMIGTRAFRLLGWGVDKAIVTNSRKENLQPFVPECFELAWIKKTWSYRSGDHLLVLSKFPGPIGWFFGSFFRYLGRCLIKDKIQIFRSVLSAHTSVQKWEKRGLAGHPEVMKLSKQICEKASVSLAKLEEHHPDIFAELSTQQAAHLLLTEVVHEAEKLRTLGQLSKNETEFIVTRLKNQIFFLKDVDVESTVAERREKIIHPFFDVSFMSVIPQDDIQNVWQKVSAQRMECEPGDPITKEGENATDIYYIVHGSVHIFKEDPSLNYNKAFKEVTLAVGGVFGELELMCVDATQGPRNVGMTAVATSKTSLMRISYTDMFWILSEYPAVRQRLWQLLGKTLLDQWPELLSRPANTSSLKFGNSVMRRPAQFVTIDHKGFALLVRGQIRRGNGELINSIRLIEGDAKDSTITFISQNTLVLLFSQKNKASTKHHIQNTVDRLATSNRSFPNLTPSGRWLINVPSNLSDYDEHGNSRHTSPAQRPVAAVGVSKSNIRQKKTWNDSIERMSSNVNLVGNAAAAARARLALDDGIGAHSAPLRRNVLSRMSPTEESQGRGTPSSETGARMFTALGKLPSAESKQSDLGASVGGARERLTSVATPRVGGVEIEAHEQQSPDQMLQNMSLEMRLMREEGISNPSPRSPRLGTSSQVVDFGGGSLPQSLSAGAPSRHPGRGVRHWKDEIEALDNFASRLKSLSTSGLGAKRAGSSEAAKRHSASVSFDRSAVVADSSGPAASPFSMTPYRPGQTYGSVSVTKPPGMSHAGEEEMC